MSYGHSSLNENDLQLEAGESIVNGMKKGYLIGIAILLVAVCFVIFAKRNRLEDNGKVRVTASFYPLYFFTSQIAGDRAEVSNITPAGAEPHDYEPSASDIARMERSDLIVLNGGNLEPWADSIRQNIDSEKTLILNAGDGLISMELSEEGKKINDPHVWLSPVLAVQMANEIEKGLSVIDREGAVYYKTNGDILRAKLTSLDAEYKASLGTCKTRNIVTSHEAFGYLAKTYNLTQTAITGVSPDAEPSPKDLARIAKFAKDNKIEYIFFESLVSPKLSETLASEIGAKTLVLNPLEGLTSEEAASGKDYFSEMRNNLANLKIALSCTP
jgi:zinc transport system substrate-binding protein